MAKRVVILGKCGPDEDAKALKALVQFVSDTQPDELVCVDRSIPLLEQLREVYDGPVGVHASNLEARFGATALPSVYGIAPGWISTARDDCCDVSRIGGATALNAARKFNKSVVMGHTHRLGVISHSYGYGGRVVKDVTGFEVGNLMDMRKATYLKGGAANWQQGFGLLTVEFQHVKPEIVPITKGRFTVDGQTWEV